MWLLIVILLIIVLILGILAAVSKSAPNDAKLTAKVTHLENLLKESQDEVARLRQQIKTLEETMHENADEILVLGEDEPLAEEEMPVIREIVIDDTKQRELLEACHRGDTGMARSLLESLEVDVNASYDKAKHGEKIGGSTWYNGKTCLMFASLQGRVETVAMLLREFKANVDQQDEGGWTALHSAASQGHLDVVRLLCEDGNANLEAKTYLGQTAVMRAAWTGRKDVVQYLLKQGAKPNETDNDGKTAFSYARGDDLKKMLKNIN